MEASTRSPGIDLSKYLTTEDSYVVRGNTVSGFFVEPTLADLESTCEVAVGGLKVLECPELMSAELKVLIAVHDKFYHFFVDTLPLILKLHRLDPETRFVLYIKKSKQINSKSFLKVLFEVLEDLGAKWTAVESVYEDDFSPAYKIRNFARTDETVFNLHAALSLADVMDAVLLLKRKYLGAEVGESPWRKVYMPYASINSNGFGTVYIQDGSYEDDARIYDEWKLRQYFVDAGYEVIIPEEEFEAGGIAEQIRFMSEVSVLASVSSSGLTNALFMQPGGTVVEVAAEIVVVNGIRSDGLVTTNQGIPFEYHPLSFAAGHTHVMIPTRRNTDTAIERLKKAGI